MTPAQFRDWLRLIVNESLFTDRDKLTALLAQNADRETLAEGFREFFESYSYDLAFELDAQEACVLKVLEGSEEFGHLKQRVAAIEAERKTLPIGRQMRRFGGTPNKPVPTIKVADLSDNDFLALTETLVNSELFASREQVVKLIKEPASRVNHVQLQSAFYEFFVCHLELEQFLESYEYDPDERLDISLKVAEEVNRSVADYESGKVKRRSLEEVAEELGVEPDPLYF
ncbi:hypothetical protein J4G08_20370 [Candidatus Poribacteria bacterium]|nr:hypothetical protein [Candidatus Poribacteria bacterium]